MHKFFILATGLVVLFLNPLDAMDLRKEACEKDILIGQAHTPAEKSKQYQAFIQRRELDDASLSWMINNIWITGKPISQWIREKNKKKPSETTLKKFFDGLLYLAKKDNAIFWTSKNPGFFDFVGWYTERVDDPKKLQSIEKEGEVSMGKTQEGVNYHFIRNNFVLNEPSTPHAPVKQVFLRYTLVFKEVKVQCPEIREYILGQIAEKRTMINKGKGGCTSF